MNGEPPGLPAELAGSRLGALVDAVVAHWDDVLAALGPPERQELLGLVTGLGEHRPDRAVEALEDLLAEADLPAGHPVPVALLGRVRRHGVADPDTDRVEAALQWLERAVRRAPVPVPSRAQVATRLLSLTYSADEVRARGDDPHRPGLIRLRHLETGEIRLPRFQFAAGGAQEAVLAVNHVLDAEHDPWGVAGWWVDRHAWLECAPVELLDGGEERLALLAAAAEAEVAD